MNKKIWVFAMLVFLLLASKASALGVTPGRATFNFEQGIEKRQSFSIINSEHKNLDLIISVQGELNDSINVEDKSVIMGENEETKAIEYALKISKNLEPGLHNSKIVVLQKPENSGASGVHIGAALAVAIQIYVYVPYPGKYVESEINVMGGENDKKFLIVLVGRGEERVNSAYADIEIRDSGGRIVKTLKTNEVSISLSERKEIYADWAADVASGKYYARATLHYDGESRILEKEFEVGELLLDLQQIFVKDFSLGGIAKFNMVVQNKWGEMISNAYAELRVFDSAMNEIGDMKSATYDIPAGMQTTMNLYWDTKNIAAGLYKANVVLNYADKRTQQDLKLDVKQNSIDVIGLGYVISSAESGSSGNKGLITIIISLVVLIILINLSWFLFLRKRFKK